MGNLYTSLKRSIGIYVPDANDGERTAGGGLSALDQHPIQGGAVRLLIESLVPKEKIMIWYPDLTLFDLRFESKKHPTVEMNHSASSMP